LAPEFACLYLLDPSSSVSYECFFLALTTMWE
jgi:hypothetical protein